MGPDDRKYANNGRTRRIRKITGGPDKIISVEQQSSGSWAVKYRKGGLVKYVTKPTEDKARKVAARIEGNFKNPDAKTDDEQSDAGPFIPSSPQKASKEAVPETLENLRDLIADTLDGVRHGRIDPKTAPAIVQLAKAQANLLRITPKKSELADLECKGDDELLDLLVPLICDRVARQTIDGFIDRMRERLSHDPPG